VLDAAGAAGRDDTDADDVFHTIRELRIPVEYLAELFTAGDVAPVCSVLRKLAAMRSYMRDINMGRGPDESIAQAVGMTGQEMQDMYRLLAIAKYDERYVVPMAHGEDAGRLLAQHEQMFCSLDTEGGPGMGGAGPEAEGGEAGTFRADDGRVHFNLLGWDGDSPSPHLFPESGGAS
jgi:nitrate reductase beta subunit